MPSNVPKHRTSWADTSSSERAIVLAFALTIAACGGRSSAALAPSATDGSITASTTGTYTGFGPRRHGEQRRTPVAGATVSPPAHRPRPMRPVAYELTLPASAASTLITITGTGFLQRKTYWSASSARSTDWDVIQEAGGFDLKFYRQFVRERTGLDRAAADSPLDAQSVGLPAHRRRGRRADRRGNARRDRAHAPTETVPMWSAQQCARRRSCAAPTAAPAGRDGSRWRGRPSVRTDRCGQTTASGDSALIELFPRAQACRRWGSGPAVYQKLVRHELGHADGLLPHRQPRTT